MFPEPNFEDLTKQSILQPVSFGFKDPCLRKEVKTHSTVANQISL